ncbi:hypothetical protein pb186bvf_017609 [Paramecium bursaria]
MNIKIVFNKKIHKLSAKYQTYDQVIQAIILLYPQLKDGLHLFISLNPQDQPIEITSDYIFSTVQKLYKENGWDGVKLLVKDKNSANLNEDDLNVLSQSLIQKQQQSASQINISIPPLQKVQKQEETPTRLADYYNPPQTNNDYLQQVDQLKQLQQQNVELFVNKQPEKQQVYQQLERVDSSVQDVVDSQKQENQLDKLDGNQQLIEYLSELIDNRFRFHGLITQQEKVALQQNLQPLLKMRLVKNDYDLKYIHEHLDISFMFHIENLSNIPWNKGQVFLQGYTVPINKTFQINESVQPGCQLHQMIIVQIPHIYVNPNQSEYSFEFRLNHLENDIPTPFGQKIIFIVKIQDQQLSNSKNDILKQSETIRQNDHKQQILIQQAKYQKYNGHYWTRLNQGWKSTRQISRKIGLRNH